MDTGARLVHGRRPLPRPVSDALLRMCLSFPSEHRRPIIRPTMSTKKATFFGTRGLQLGRISAVGISAAPQGVRVMDTAARSGEAEAQRDPAAEIAGEGGGGAVMRAGPEHPTRLDRFLAEQRPGVPFSFVQKLIRMRKVRIKSSNGVWVRETTPGRHLDTGMLVRVYSKLFE